MRVDSTLFVPATSLVTQMAWAHAEGRLVRGVGLERQVAQFVDDQQLGLGEVDEPVLDG